jgi:hypothetical protein
MPALRSSALRLALAAAVCLASVASAFHPGTALVVAAACPVSPPTPLRMLYKDSERVVVARVGNSEVDKTSNDDSFRRTTFHIGESLKGGHGEETLQVVHYTSTATPEFAGNFKKGERLLLFLNRDDDKETYRVNDLRYGAKRLSDEDLKVYLKRIEELSALLLKEKPDDKEIVEWLVRCAEEPATRWEGAYELKAGFALARHEANAAAGNEGPDAEEGEGSEEDEAEESEESEVTDESEESSNEAVEAGAAELVQSESVVETTIDAKVLNELPLFAGAGAGKQLEVQSPEVKLQLRLGMYGTDIAPEAVAALTQDQRTRLANALFRADKVGEGETELLEVVKGWGDERLVPFLVAQLRGLEKDPPYLATELMSALAEALKDKTVAKLAEHYMENAPYEDYFEGEPKEAGESGDVDEEQASQKAGRAADANRTKVSAVQKRGDMLREFLAAAENRVQYDLAMQLSR